MTKLIVIFFKSLGWYFLLTIPSLLNPLMYVISVEIALAVCWIAGLFFIVSALFIKQFSGKHPYKIFALAASAIIAVLLAFQFVEVFKLWDHIWRDKDYLLFPLAALVSAWIGIYRGKHELAEFFNSRTEIQSLGIGETVQSPENIPS